MTRDEDRERPRTQPDHPAARDGRWLAEVPDELAALSLGSDAITPLGPGGLGCVDCDDASVVPAGEHRDFGC